MHVTWLGTCTRPSMRLQRRWAAWRTLKLWTISRSWWQRAVTRRTFGAKLIDKPMFATLPQTIISPKARAKTFENLPGLIGYIIEFWWKILHSNITQKHGLTFFLQMILGYSTYCNRKLIWLHLNPKRHWMFMYTQM